MCASFCFCASVGVAQQLEEAPLLPSPDALIRPQEVDPLLGLELDNLRRQVRVLEERVEGLESQMAQLIELVKALMEQSQGQGQ